MITFVASYAGYLIPLLITIGFGVWAMSSPKLAKFCFILSAILAEFWVVYWLQTGNDLDSNYRIIIGLTLTIVITISLAAIWVRINNIANFSNNPNHIESQFQEIEDKESDTILQRPNLTITKREIQASLHESQNLLLKFIDDSLPKVIVYVIEFRHKPMVGDAIEYELMADISINGSELEKGFWFNSHRTNAVLAPTNSDKLILAVNKSDKFFQYKEYKKTEGADSIPYGVFNQLVDDLKFDIEFICKEKISQKIIHTDHASLQLTNKLGDISFNFITAFKTEK